MPENHDDVQSDASSPHCVDGDEAFEPTPLRDRLLKAGLNESQIKQIVDDLPPGGHTPTLNFQPDSTQGEYDGR